IVIAADRAATMATTIHRTCRNVGHPCCVARAASNAPVSENGSANTECSNLIISSTVLMRPVISISRLGLFRSRSACPAIHLLLREMGLREHAADILRNKIVDRFRMMIKRGNRGHDDRASLLCAKHVLQMHAVERSVAHAKNQLAAFLQHHVGGARNEIVADSARNRPQRAHRAGNYDHGIDHVAARGDGRADVSIRQNFYFCCRVPENAAGQLLQIARGKTKLFREEPLPRFRDHEVHTRNARIFFEQSQRLLRENGPAGPGHTYGYNLFLYVSHVFCADRFSLAAASGQVKLRSWPRAVLEFAAAGQYESERFAENSGICESWRTRA